MLNIREVLYTNKDVLKFQNAGGPVVALETAVLTHGLPYPENLAAAQAMVAAVRDEDAVPAVIGCLDGIFHIGMDEAQMADLASRKEPVKISGADIGPVAALNRSGGTTVSATMALAARAGIRVFATGGIGGVHRGAAATMDISADLDALARYPVAVVSSGAKVILDLPLTLEALETRNVPVIGYGTDFFPAFYAGNSLIRLHHRIDDPATVARLLATHWDLAPDKGILIAVPAPPAVALDFDQIDQLVTVALAKAAALGITGKDVTPYLLAAMATTTGGAALRANRALLVANARLAARIARAAYGDKKK